jgi:hypothetical protein
VRERSFRRLRRRGGASAFCLLTALILGGGVSAGQVPPDLASLAARLYELSADELAAAGDDQASRAAAGRAGSALRRAGVPHWAGEAVVLEGAGARAAELLGLDLSEAADRARLRELLALPEPRLRETLARESEGVGDAALDELVGALGALRAPEGRGSRYSLDLGDGETLSIEWDPGSGQVRVRARSDGSVGEPYDASLLGRAVLAPNPETGALEVELETDPASTASVLAGRELEALRGSILGEWKRDNGELWIISAADEAAGEVRGDSEDYEALIAEAEAEIEAVESAVEYVWTHPETGAVERQRRFRRLGEPWVYEGERALNDNADDEIAALRRRIEALRSRQAGAHLPPAVRQDPVGFEANRDAPGAQPIRIEVRQPDGHRYTYDQVSFDGRRIAGRRTLRDVREINRELPEKIQRDLIASWSPPNWLDLEAGFDPATGAVELTGDVWSMHVTWSRGFFGAGVPEVVSIETPYPIPVRFAEAGASTRVALGAAEDALP